MAEEDASEEWKTLIQLLSAERERLIEGFSKWFSSTPKQYLDLVPMEEILEVSKQSMDRFILLFLGEPLPDYLATLPVRLGSRRAQQRVPKDLLTDATRGAFGVLWAELHRLATPDYIRTLADNVDQVFLTVESFVSEVERAFVIESELLLREPSQISRRFVSKLLSSEFLQDSELREISEALRLSVIGEFEVLVGVSAELEHMQTQVGAFDPNKPTYLDELNGAVIAFREKLADQPWRQSMTGLSFGYIGDIDGLANLSRAVESARLLGEIAHAAQSGLVTIETGWRKVVAVQLDLAFPGFRSRLINGLSGLPHQEQEQFKELIRQYTASGSVAQTAKVLYCHRNTVINRIQGFRELTGLDIRVPDDAALAVLAYADME